MHRHRGSFIAIGSLALACSTEEREGQTPTAADASAACSAAGAYPPGPYGARPGEVSPNISLPGVLSDGTGTTIAFQRYYEPCSSQRRLVVFRIGTTWCGGCRWNAAHSRELADLDVGPRLRLVDALVRNGDNEPANEGDLFNWCAQQNAPIDAMVDHAFTLRSLVPDRAHLPLILLIETTHMTVRAVLQNPSPDALSARIHADLAILDGHAAEAIADAPRIDGLFTRDEWDMVQEMAEQVPLLPDPTNRVADDTRAAALGKALFDDRLLSPTAKVACATCHDAARFFADGRPTPTAGSLPGDRNVPSVLFASRATWQLWDGRADTLWMQALLALENPREVGSSRLFVAHAVFDRYRAAYEAVFGPLLNLSDLARFPADGMPGQPEWTTISPADRAYVTTVFVNVGKSIAAFERTLGANPQALDAYARGNFAAFTAVEKKGLRAFFDAGCTQCHFGPRLTNDAFHNLHFATGRADKSPDRGRIDGVPALLQSELAARGPYSDSPAAGSLHDLSTTGPWALGLFKTPSLRGVAVTAPYGHGGTLTALAEVIEAHRVAGSLGTAGDFELLMPSFDAATGAATLPFLATLTLP